MSHLYNCTWVHMLEDIHVHANFVVFKLCLLALLAASVLHK